MMNLSDEEKRMLNGVRGDAARKAMELLIAVGECFGAERMLPIASAHLVAATPTTAGKGGVSFIMDMKDRGGSFKIPVTTNPNCLEPWQWSDMGFEESLYRENERLTRALVEMGAYSTQTCTPYLIGHAPHYRQSLAWGESSAVVYSNSVLGSRTNREGGPTALAGAITGLTPEYGLHLDEYRKPTVKFVLDTDLKSDYEYALAGYYVGKIAGDRVPLIVGLNKGVANDSLKCFGAAAAVSGSVALFHVSDVTPEAMAGNITANTRFSDSDSFRIGKAELKAMEHICSHTTVNNADLVILGCPHASIEQIRVYAKHFIGKKIKSNVTFWVLSSHVVKRYAEDLGYARVLAEAGVRLVSNTCPASMPQNFFASKGYSCVATNSTKLAYYASTRQGVAAYCGSLESILTHSVKA